MLEFEAFDARIPVAAEDRAQIAGVAIHWSYLELMVERAIANLEGRGGDVEYTEGIDRRVKHLKDVAANSPALTAEQLGDLKAICSDILAARPLRDRVIHGLWSLSSNGELAASLHPWAKDQTIRSLDGSGIRTIKLHIYGLHRRLQPFVDATAEVRIFGARQGQKARPRKK